MSFSIRQIIRGFVAPWAVLGSAPHTWKQLMRELGDRGHGMRESGAFLLGNIHQNGYREVRTYVPYDDLDPESLNGAIYFHSAAYGELWKVCREKNLKVVADIHTHPGQSVTQSYIDQTHPMISSKGHIALIAPDFGRTPTSTRIGVFRYLGSHQWETLQDGLNRPQALYIGWWW